MAHTGDFRLSLPEAHRAFGRTLAAAVSRVVNIPNPNRWLSYVAAFLAAALATAVRWVLGSVLGPNLHPFITFYPMVMLAALLGGTGPGLLATLLAAVIVPYLFLEPPGISVQDPGDQVGLVLFIAINVSVSFVCGALRTARQRTFAEARRAQASEERFRLFMDHTPTLAWIKDEEGRYTYLNKAYEQRFGHTLAECQGKTDADLWPPDVAARLHKADQAALAAGRPIELTEETTEPSGAVSFWLNTKFPVRDAAGRQFIASIGLDITDRRRAQEAVQESEARLRLAVSTAELGTYERDLVSNKITLNSACQAILGAAEPFPPDLLRRSLHPEDRDRVLAIVARAFDPRARVVSSAEFRLVRPDGTIRWVAARGRVLFDDQANPPRPIRFIGVLNDITSRKRYEDSLLRTEARLTQALRVARIGTFEIDVLTDSVEFSPELRELYGFAPDAPVTLRAVLERIPPVERHQLLAAIRQARDPCGEGVLEIEHRILAPGREPRWLSLRSQTLFTGDDRERRPIRIIGAALDITEQKEHAASLTRLVRDRTARLQETVAELEHFSYTITHDMRAPLRAMSGYAAILASRHVESLNAQGRDLLRRISESAVRMDHLITDALQYSRVVRDRYPLQPVEPAAAIRGLVESYPQFQPPHAHITVQPQMPPVLANQAGFTQVFSNLLGNAVKFVVPGQVPQINVTAEIRPPMPNASSGSALQEGASTSNTWVRISVVDNGIGIPPEYHDRIWQMFQRLGKTYEGTGIGLALVRKVVERMGGRAGVESLPGQGSCFWVELQKAAD